MRLLDLFCGAGGCSMGYHHAGFDVVGVDLAPMKRYPFEFRQEDALAYLEAHGREFDAIHASPPCQKYSSMRHMPNARKDHSDLVEPTRKLLQKIGKPYVIENVPGAPLARGSILLCGTMFGLGVKAARAELWRHRWFETSFGMLRPECDHQAVRIVDNYGHGTAWPNSREKMRRLQTIGVYGGGGPHYSRPPRATKVIGVYGDHGRDRRRNIQVVGVYGNQGHHNNQAPRRPATVGCWGNTGGISIRDGVQQFTTAERREAMGIDWMTGKELSQAIPPAYTQYIGEWLMRYLNK